ncbi:hypothetical protein I3760_01G105300 [Carya illinoinensis]|nr:hypothetical protein I3760_01G105300 [Carya illinoinensis]
MSQDATSTCIEGIEEKHESLTPIAEKRCMYKVHEQLRKVNKEAYEPVLLAIGPYNYNQGKPVGGAFMKERKECYLQQMLERTIGSKERYMKALEKLEVKARTCYVECTSQISPREFAEMMLLDGCFIIELFRKYEIYCNTGDGSDDPIFKMEWVLPRIARDLLLFENQLPFFVLLELFRMTESRNSRELVVDIHVESSTSKDPSICKFSQLALDFFHCYLPFKWDVDASNYNSKAKIKHLVCLMNETLIPSLPKMVWKRLQVGFRFKNVDQFEHLLGLIHATICISILDAEIAHARERHDQAKKVILKMPKIFQHPVIPLLAKRKDMSNQEPLLPEGLEGDSEEDMEAETDQGWERESIPNGSELKEAGITFKMAKKFKDHVNEIQAWEKESIKHAFELQEAGIELKDAMEFNRLLRGYPAEEHNSRLYSKLLSEAKVKFRKAKNFIRLREEAEELTLVYMNVHCAIELEEAGIEFKLDSKKDKWFSLKFNNGVMEVSPLSIEDQTETCLRNLIAYEQYCDTDESLNYVTNFVRFLDSLINSSKDVELLRQRGIIQNYLGDDGAISTMVNKLCDNINLSTNNIYDRTSRNMNLHCARRWHKWTAKLRHDYFNSPWALISFLAAVLLLVLTIVQTIFSIIP